MTARPDIAGDLTASSSIDEAMIETLVRCFYTKIRQDAVLGPIFASKITDWEPHLQKMFAFWSSVVLRTGRYSGNPMAKHIPLPVDAAHFDRWLALFEETAREQCPPDAADHFVARARQIAESLELGVASSHGIMLKRGARFRKV
jgi:hemoglobin